MKLVASFHTPFIPLAYTEAMMDLERIQMKKERPSKGPFEPAHESVENFVRLLNFLPAA